MPSSQRTADPLLSPAADQPPQHKAACRTLSRKPVHCPCWEPYLFFCLPLSAHLILLRIIIFIRNFFFLIGVNFTFLSHFRVHKSTAFSRSQCCATVSSVSFQNIFFTQKETACLRAVTPHSRLPPGLTTSNLLSVCVDLPILEFSHKRNHAIRVTFCVGCRTLLRFTVININLSILLFSAVCPPSYLRKASPDHLLSF